MSKVMIIGCGAYMDGGYGCPGEWRCLKAAAMGDGSFAEPMQVISFIKCACPGRNLAPNTAMAIKLAETKPDALFMSTCLTKAKPGCPYATAEELAAAVEGKTGVKVILGTHEYPI